MFGATRNGHAKNRKTALISLASPWTLLNSQLSLHIGAQCVRVHTRHPRWYMFRVSGAGFRHDIEHIEEFRVQGGCRRVST